MIKVKKISLENFKGIKPKTVFHFDIAETHVNILSGPNGFGKTTIFDIIEICLTGEFKRVELFDHVQKKNNNKNKPFFQNTDGENVILKLWVHNSTTNIDHIIIKYYDDGESPTKIDHGRDFIPADARNIFTTYLTTDSTHFTEDNFSTLSPVRQTEINNLFYGVDSTVDLASIYYLFNYIQQADSIYFLRKNEDDKGASLGFLFNIEKEEAEKQKLLELKSNLIRQQTLINQELEQLRKSLPDTQSGDYEKLFKEKDFDFDKEKPFIQLNTAIEQLKSFQDILASLTILKNNFSPDEYEKSIKYKKLNDEVLSNQQILNAILIRNIYTDELIANIEAINSKIGQANNFLQSPNTAFISKEYFDSFLASPEEYTAYAIIERDIKAINRDLGDIGKIISEINSSRNQTLEEFKKIKHTEHVSDTNCPLCDTNFESFEFLEQAINIKTTSLQVYSSEKLQTKTNLEEQIKIFHSRLTESATEFIAANNITEQPVLALLREYSALKEKTEEIFAIYAILGSSGMKAIDFSQSPKTMAEISEKRALLKAFLERDLLSELLYNEQLIDNKQLYVHYFDADRTKFSEITIEMIVAKSQYILGSYAQIANSRLTFLESREQKLSNLLQHITSIYDKVHKSIQEHKVELIEKIKVPFYIYSGKILQSYQQGLGIFVEIHPTGLSNNVRFKTGHSSDHDIVYHLSSGQMAVVSLAFCLSLNKVYNTNENFKFLSIDDPVQTMDDLNIHTFIELVRNEFKDYQIIMSTHDDFTSRYMKYKFDKFEMNTEIQNVQTIVLESTFN
ncbi:AAA family ATPase [Albibacterium bauzanense]|uniref:Exonuclease SbcC n=1 Tax=Albibacterium bauzanense TaxID=653929 RepID=A0A4R1LU79_9SPHI|nr:AAA family ATPase [Albibacterium bauzanense]TCK82908.1 exonuclease SbcC [Albibacterium bauzanense]